MRERKRFQPEEDKKLLKLYDKYGSCFSKIAQEMPGRSAKHVRERLVNYLIIDKRKAEWTPEEDALLIDLLEKHGEKWSSLHLHFKYRLSIDIKNRIHFLNLKAPKTKEQKRDEKFMSDFRKKDNIDEFLENIKIFDFFKLMPNQNSNKELKVTDMSNIFDVILKSIDPIKYQSNRQIRRSNKNNLNLIGNCLSCSNPDEMKKAMENEVVLKILEKMEDKNSFIMEFKENVDKIHESYDEFRSKPSIIDDLLWPEDPLDFASVFDEQDEFVSNFF